MNGSRIVADTNVLIYLFKGEKSIEEFLQDKDIFISFITQIELFSLQELTPSEASTINSALQEMSVVHSNEQIISSAIYYRTTFNLKIPDCIIAATARFLKVPLFTADKAFRKIDLVDLIVV